MGYLKDIATDLNSIGGFAEIFSLLGMSSPEREAELGEQLDKLAYEDFAVAKTADRMVECLETALKDVGKWRIHLSGQGSRRRSLAGLIRSKFRDYEGPGIGGCERDSQFGWRT